ncbi:MAG: hypothetical protein AB1894_03475 [Chloroflexota bacterium]
MNLDPLVQLEPLDVERLDDAGMAAAWKAAEALISSDLQQRRQGMEQLLALQVAPVSPLVAYLLYTRLVEPDLDLRRRVVQALAGILEAGPSESPARQNLAAHLGQMRTRQIYALLQLVTYDADLESPVVLLLKTCSYAGSQLAAILADRQMPVGIRTQAARMAGKIGYMDAVQSLERVQTRLESRLPPQQNLALLEIDVDDELNLLPVVREALLTLRAP